MVGVGLLEAKQLVISMGFGPVVSLCRLNQGKGLNLLSCCIDALPLPSCVLL